MSSKCAILLVRVVEGVSVVVVEVFYKQVRHRIIFDTLSFNMRRNIVQNIFPSKLEKEKLLTQLNLLGATTVVVEFRGGGDEGEIESVYYIDRNGESQEIPKDMISWTQVVYGDKPKLTKEMSLVDALEDLCYRALDEASMDWYNNEGGQGSLVIDFRESPPKTCLELGINSMSTEDYKFAMDEEEDE